MQAIHRLPDHGVHVSGLHGGLARPKEKPGLRYNIAATLPQLPMPRGLQPSPASAPREAPAARWCRHPCGSLRAHPASPWLPGSHRCARDGNSWAVDLVRSDGTGLPRAPRLLSASQISSALWRAPAMTCARKLAQRCRLRRPHAARVRRAERRFADIYHASRSLDETSFECEEPSPALPRCGVTCACICCVPEGCAGRDQAVLSVLVLKHTLLKPGIS